MKTFNNVKDKKDFDEETFVEKPLSPLVLERKEECNTENFMLTLMFRQIIRKMMKLF